MQFRLHQAEQRSKQESNLITNQAHSVLYGNRKILPIYQKLEQWKESAEQVESAELTESNSQTETEMQLIQEIESMEKIKTGEIWTDAI